MIRELIQRGIYVSIIGSDIGWLPVCAKPFIELVVVCGNSKSSNQKYRVPKHSRFVSA